jgi:hydroxyethylthiazole kinase
MQESVQAAASTLERVRLQRPLIHLISNLVTLLDVANATLAIGARPVMAHAPEEVEEICRAARALVVNLGTPSRERIQAMRLAGLSANATGIPVVLDPVGIGASQFRKQAMQTLRSVQFAIIRGNAAEMGLLAGKPVTFSGVDTLKADYDRQVVARTLAEEFRTTVVVAGSPDYVSNGKRVWTIENGSEWLRRITGAGDMQSAMIAAAAAVEGDPLVAAASGIAWLGIAAEQAALESKSVGPGTFRAALFDALGNLDPEAVIRMARINCV